jgi:hypothetical protein
MPNAQAPKPKAQSVDTTENKPTPDRSRKRLNLDLSPDAYDLLQQIVDESGKSMAEVLRTGLALYGIAQEEQKRGHKITISDTNDTTLKEILIPR